MNQLLVASKVNVSSGKEPMFLRGPVWHGQEVMQTPPLQGSEFFPISYACSPTSTTQKPPVISPAKKYTAPNCPWCYSVLKPHLGVCSYRLT